MRRSKSTGSALVALCALTSAARAQDQDPTPVTIRGTFNVSTGYGILWEERPDVLIELSSISMPLCRIVTQVGAVQATLSGLRRPGRLFSPRELSQPGPLQERDLAVRRQEDGSLWAGELRLVGDATRVLLAMLPAQGGSARLRYRGITRPDGAEQLFVEAVAVEVPPGTKERLGDGRPGLRDLPAGARWATRHRGSSQLLALVDPETHAPGPGFAPADARLFRAPGAGEESVPARRGIAGALGG